jgi:hypothetical protein
MRHSANLWSTALVIFTVLILIGVMFASYLLQQARYTELAVPNVQLGPDVTATATPIASRTPFALSDCGWVAEARAFVDGNANGKWDRGERPLAGVAFHVDDVLSGIQDVGEYEAISGTSGSAELLVRRLCSSASDLGVYAVPPAGYIFTTHQRVSEDELLVFGFSRSNALPGMPGAGHP